MFVMSRDFLKGPTPEELQKYKDITGKDFGSNKLVVPVRRYDRKDIPEACRRCEELFPNNYLDPVEVWNKDYLKAESIKFQECIKNASTEREILNYINQNEKYCIVGSLLRKSSIRTGNHGVYVFPEFQLGNSYSVDYLIIGKSSDGYEFVFVELESPEGRIIKADGEFGEVIRKGLKQVNDWKRFLESDFISINTTLNKYRYKLEFSTEFYKYDSSRMHYVIVAGRRNDYTDISYRKRREIRQNENITILHYDNLVDAFEELTEYNYY